MQRQMKRMRPIEIIKTSIHKLNLEIIILEEMLHPNYKQELENKLKLKKAGKAGLKKPLEIKKPDATDPERQKEIEVINGNIATKQSEIKSYTASITNLQAEKIDLSKKINNANALLQKLDNSKNNLIRFMRNVIYYAQILEWTSRRLQNWKLIRLI